MANVDMELCEKHREELDSLVKAIKQHGLTKAQRAELRELSRKIGKMVAVCMGITIKPKR